MKKIQKSRKADLSINTTVIAALALIVLVVLITIFGGRIRTLLEGSRDCGTRGGICETRDECPVGMNIQHTDTECADRNDEDTPLLEQYICCEPTLR
jgi:hypothetical protein